METLEQLQARHRKEQRDLQARVTQKKRGASKKTRKGVNTECEELERTLRDKQKQELAILNSDSVPIIDDGSELDQGPVDEDVPLPSSTSPAKDPVKGLQDGLIVSTLKPGDADGLKRSRQKERLARRAAEQEAAAIEAEAEAAKMPNWKRQERSSMVRAFKENGLIEKEIAPDGHCLFSAVADQLSEAGILLSEGGEGVQGQDGKYKVVRKTAARYIERHPNEFAGFLDEPLGTYVHKIRDTAEWGGQVELIALAKSYNIEICVLQDGRIDRFEPETENGLQPEKIWLAYYRHGYGLGEHYNSLRKAP